MDNHFDSNPDKLLLSFGVAYTKSGFEMNSAHYSYSMLDSLDYDPEDFLNFSLKNGIINLFSNEGLDQIYLKNIIDVSLAFDIDPKFYE